MSFTCRISPPLSAALPPPPTTTLWGPQPDAGRRYLGLFPGPILALLI